MATIATVGRNQYRATFNQRSLRIDANGKTLVATDTVTGDTLTGAELHSVQALVTWHVKSKRDSNELPALWTVR